MKSGVIQIESELKMFYVKVYLIRSFFRPCFLDTWKEQINMGNTKSRLSPEAVSELQRLTDFSEQEIQQWYKGFIKDCPSGLLSLLEFRKIYTNFFPNGDSSKFADVWFLLFGSDMTKILLRIKKIILGV